MKIMKERFYNTLNENTTEEKAGFRRRYSIVDHIHTLIQITEKAKEYNIELHLVFVDLCKAFDSIDQVVILETIKEQGVPTKIVRLLANMYADANAYIRMDQVGPKFSIGRGVKQGDPLSSNLFDATLEGIFGRQLRFQNQW